MSISTPTMGTILNLAVTEKDLAWNVLIKEQMYVNISVSLQRSGG